MTRSEPREAGLLGRRDFIRLAEFVHTRSGIRMPPSKKTFLEGRIRRHLSALGFATMNEYCKWLFDEGGLVQDEAALLDAVTTNKTEFFRERHHFEFVSNVILPDFRAASSGSLRPLLIWSAGCSNGAEPYSLAMICEDFAPHKFRIPLRNPRKRHLHRSPAPGRAGDISSQRDRSCTYGVAQALPSARPRQR